MCVHITVCYALELYESDQSGLFSVRLCFACPHGSCQNYKQGCFLFALHLACRMNPVTTTVSADATAVCMIPMCRASSLQANIPINPAVKGAVAMTYAQGCDFNTKFQDVKAAGEGRPVSPDPDKSRR